MPRLTAKDHEHFKRQGFLHVPGLVPRENCRAVVDAMFEFLGMAPNHPEDWYRPPLKGGKGGMVEFYHHQSLWNNRQLPGLYEVFSELLGETKLICTLDRVSFKLPENPKHPEFSENGFLHLDGTPKSFIGNPDRPALQGVIYLTDTSEDQGGFHCVPGFNRNIRAWAALPDAQRPADPPDFSKMKPTPIPGKAGDVIIWDVMLPHGSGPNRTTQPRLAQYVLMSSAVGLTPEDRAERVRRWRECLPTFSGDPRKIEETAGKPATLTPLGKRLLGLEEWE